MILRFALAISLIALLLVTTNGTHHVPPPTLISSTSPVAIAPNYSIAVPSFYTLLPAETPKHFDLDSYTFYTLEPTVLSDCLPTISLIAYHPNDSTQLAKKKLFVLEGVRIQEALSTGQSVYDITFLESRTKTAPSSDHAVSNSIHFHKQLLSYYPVTRYQTRDGSYTYVVEQASEYTYRDRLRYVITTIDSVFELGVDFNSMDSNCIVEKSAIDNLAFSITPAATPASDW